LVKEKIDIEDGFNIRYPQIKIYKPEPMFKRLFAYLFRLWYRMFQELSHTCTAWDAYTSILFAKINTPYENYTFIMAFTHFSYYPRFTLTESDNSSISIESPLGAGGCLLNSGSNANGIAWGIDLPLAIDYNMGCQSTPGNENRFGGYFGGGFGYMYTGWSDGGITSKAITYGPLARTGIRFSSKNGRWTTTVGIFGKFGLEKEKYKTFGFNVLSEF
jgi:hypothetical protein